MPDSMNMAGISRLFISQQTYSPNDRCDFITDKLCATFLFLFQRHV